MASCGCFKAFVLGLFELPEDDSTPADEHFIEIEDTPGYQTAYSQLVFAGARSKVAAAGPVAHVADPRANLAQSLGKLAAGRPAGMLQPLVGSMQPQAKAYLDKYLQMAGVSL